MTQELIEMITALSKWTGSCNDMANIYAMRQLMLATIGRNGLLISSRNILSLIRAGMRTNTTRNKCPLGKGTYSVTWNGTDKYSIMTVTPHRAVRASNKVLSINTLVVSGFLTKINDNNTPAANPDVMYKTPMTDRGR
jgi:hypothetical protein